MLHRLCRQLKYNPKTNTCPLVCPQIGPRKSENYVMLGPKCVKEMCDVECANMGYQPSTNTCKPVCPSVHPTDCKSCMALGDYCIAEKGFARKCENWGYRNGSCERICPQMDVRTCDDCKRLGPFCVKKNGVAGTWAGYGYDIKGNTCYQDSECDLHCDSKCSTLNPTKCEDCVTVGPICVHHKHLKFCENVGYNIDNNTCKNVFCPEVGLGTLVG